MKKIGFIGLGKMGAPICENLIKKEYVVTCYDISKENLNRFKKSATIADSIEDVFLNTDIIFMSLPSSNQVEEITSVFLKLKAENKSVIDLSTSYPFSTIKINKKFEEKGWEYSDLSITGTPLQAEKGDITLLFGGSEEEYNKTVKILNSFSKKTYYMGKSGSGNIAKLANNYLAIMYDLLYAEIFPFAEAVGMDVEKLYEVIGESGVNCKLYQSAALKIVKKDFNLSFALELASKDLRYLKAMYEEIDSPSIILDGGMELIELGEKQGFGSEDITILAKVVEDFTK